MLDAHVRLVQVVNWPWVEVLGQHLADFLGFWVDHLQDLNRDRGHSTEGKVKYSDEHGSFWVCVEDEWDQVDEDRVGQRENKEDVLHVWCIYFHVVDAQASYLSYQLVVQEVNKEVASPVSQLRCTWHHDLMLDIGLTFFDNALDHLVSYHHVSNCKTHNSDHTLSSINVSLKFKAKWKWLFVEVEPQVRVLSHVAHYWLQCIGTVRHWCSGTACIQEHRDCVVAIFWRNLLDQELTSIWWSWFQPFIKYHIVKFFGLLEKATRDVSVNSFQLRKQLSFSNIRREWSLNESLDLIFCLIEVVLGIDERGTVREIICRQSSFWEILIDQLDCGNVKSDIYENHREEEVHDEDLWVTKHHEHLFLHQSEKVGQEVSAVVSCNWILSQ